MRVPRTVHRKDIWQAIWPGNKRHLGAAETSEDGGEVVQLYQSFAVPHTLDLRTLFPWAEMTESGCWL